MKYLLTDKTGQIYAEFSNRSVAESVYIEAINFRDLIILEVKEDV